MKIIIPKNDALIKEEKLFPLPLLFCEVVSETSGKSGPLGSDFWQLLPLSAIKYPSWH